MEHEEGQDNAAVKVAGSDSTTLSENWESPDEGSDVMCSGCGKGDDEAKLLLCDQAKCKRGAHVSLSLFLCFVFCLFFFFF